MPWDKDNPPSVAKNWSESERAKCISAANAVLKDGGDDEKAIQACIHAAGKTKNPGGKDEQGAKGGLVLEPITADEISQYSNHALFANIEPGSLLRFKNAVLCTIGENKNRDWIDETGLEELVATMSFRAIDDEHKESKVIGFFVNPRAEDNSTRLVTDGILYADRFPEIAAQVQSGEKKLSVEAVARKAVCSVCGGEFTSPKGYCEHLMDRPKYNALRKLYGLKAKGGATVFFPAWDTSFDENNFVMIASEIDCGCRQGEVLEASTKEPGWIQELKMWFEKRLSPVLAAIDECYCEKCDKSFPHERGVPCSETKCPDCGNMMKPKLETMEGADDKKNITKDAATKEKASNLISRLQKAHETETKGGNIMADFEIVEGETFEELKARLGLVAAEEVDALKEQFEAEKTELVAGFEAEKTTLQAETEQVRLGFERTLELGMGVEQATILASLAKDAYALFKQQREEVKVEASVETETSTEEEEEPVKKAGELQGNVLSTTEDTEDTLTLQNVGAFLSERKKGGK